MKTLYAVTEIGGPAWQYERPMNEQALWEEHKDFVNDLAARNIIVLGGPISSDVHEALLVFDAAKEDEVRNILARDPWIISGHLKTKEIRKWSIVLGMGQ